MARFALTFVLAALMAHGQAWQLAAPATIATGELASLRLTRDGVPQSGVEIRVTSPASQIATVTAATLPLRDSRVTLFKDDVVLVTNATDDACAIVTSSGATGTASCAGLALRRFGQPLGTTDPDGRVLSRDLTAVAATVELAAVRAGDTLAAATVQVTPFQFDETVPVAPGISFRSRRWVANGEGPFAMTVVEVDPNQPQTFLLPVRARDRAIGVENLSDLARRYGSLVALNGGGFVLDGAYAGASTGPSVWNGQPVALGQGTALVLCAASSARKAIIETVTIEGKATAADGHSLDLSGLNRARGENEAILYTPLAGERTRTPDGGAEAQLDLGDRVNELRDGPGNTEIPSNGRDVSGAGAAADFLRERASAGNLLRVDVPVRFNGCPATDVIAAGEQNPEERMPRTAFAITDRGTWLLAAVDGHQASTAGMRLDEFRTELNALGALQIAFLDGGNSTALALGDAIRSRPSAGEEAGVGDALLVFQISDLAELVRVLDRIASEPGQLSTAALDELNKPLREAIDAFLAGDVGGVRQAVMTVRETIKKLDGNEIATAAARVMARATDAFITTLPDIQPLRKSRSAR